jgi:hypothetical protein
VLILLKKSGDISEISVEGKFDICKTFDKTSLTPPLFVEVAVPSQEHELSCTSMSVRGIYFVSISANLVFDFINKNIIYFSAIKMLFI